MRLRRSDCSGPGIRRRRAGRGFWYFDEDGERVDDPEVLTRIAELTIPPAWKDVWICPYPNGHLQATGTDAAGRRQYLYHRDWRARRDQEKFGDMVRFARDLPVLRRRLERDLMASTELTRERVLACAVRLLDRGFFRIGSEDYAVRNETYGLATMRKEHVRIEDEHTMVFDYPSKSGRRQVRTVVDPVSCEIVARLARRRSGGDDLLVYREGPRGPWIDVRSDAINAYIKEITGADHSAKDFRTWNATVLCAVALAVSGRAAASPTGRKRAVARAIKEVALYLGNTPAVCRASYVDPRVIDAFHGGAHIGGVLDRLGDEARGGDLTIHHRDIEEAVLDLIAADYDSDAIEIAAAA